MCFSSCKLRQPKEKEGTREWKGMVMVVRVVRVGSLVVVVVTGSIS